MMPETAILHDQWTEIGGAERVAVEMARTLDAPIYVAIADPDLVPEDVTVREAFDRWWLRKAQQAPVVLQDVAQMLGWQHVDDLYEYDALIVNKNNPGWFVPKDEQVIVKYSHTTPRGTYDLFYKHGKNIITRAVKTLQRTLYQQTVPYPDVWLCNSELVARRWDRYLDKSIDEVVYPPVPVTEYSPDARATGDYYFAIGRLWGHKHIDDIVRAFRQLRHDPRSDYQLKIAGTGPERDRLEEQASENIEFLGYVSDSEKRELYAGAKATIMAAENEDFGLVPIESMAAGTPVIGVQDGYTKYQILDGENGRLFAREGGHLREAIRLFERRGVAWSDSQIQEFASQFSVERFRSELRDAIEQAREQAAIAPDWTRPTGATVPDDVADPAVTDGGHQ